MSLHVGAIRSCKVSDKSNRRAVHLQPCLLATFPVLSLSSGPTLKINAKQCGAGCAKGSGPPSATVKDVLGGAHRSWPGGRGGRPRAGLGSRKGLGGLEFLERQGVREGGVQGLWGKRSQGTEKISQGGLMDGG